MLGLDKNLKPKQGGEIMELKIPTVIRLYRYWQKKGGYWYGQENLCHFVRTVLFYAPARWFFLARRAKVVAPWSVTLLLALSMSLWLWPKNTSIIVGTITLIVAVAALLSYFSEKIEESTLNAVESVGPCLTLKVIGRLPMWFFLAAILIGLGLVFLPDFTFPTLLALFLIAAWFGFTIGVLFGMICLNDSLKKRKADRPPKEHKSSKTGEFLKVIGVYLIAIKKSICPFVEIKENSIVFYWE